MHKECAVGVVLSGTGSDGTLGLKAIKEHGGISMVQDLESAAYDSMPQSAINAGVVDFILAPEKIPQQLLEIRSTYKTSHFFKELKEMPKDDEGIFKQILLLLRQRSGVDFSYYKQPTFHRRIARRIAIVKKNNLADYLKFLRTNKTEQDALFQDVLIPVTSFFRDPKTFIALTETVFPAILKNKASDEAIRIWIAGCSTGEEAYSIAICLHEFLGGKSVHPKIQLFASDISEKAIKKARVAKYSQVDLEKLTDTQLKNYFVKNNGGYEVNKFIRDMCVFAPHNFLKDPPFAKMDLITCRNVLIYMDTFLQKKAFSTFHYALKENGFLLLGKSETTGATSDLFAQVNKHEKIYSRKPVAGRFMHAASEKGDLKPYSIKANVTHNSVVVDSDFRKSAEEIMLLKSPASVVVNEAMDIVHIHGDIAPFLQTPQGKPTHNLFKMAREGLAFELRNAIHKAKKEQLSIIKENIPAKINEKQFLVTIEIIPLTDTVEPHYLIRFEQKAPSITDEQKQNSSGKMAETSLKLSEQNQQLEKELSQNREDMRYLTEDMEATNEELQSANEELQSSNEEMQSLNEELVTSKEELQSTNEELIIVNQELLDKQEQLNVSLALQLEAHKRIEESEKEQKKLANQLKLATDSAKVGIGSLNVQTEKLEWNGLMKKMWGYNETLDNLTLEDWSNSILPEDKALTFQKLEESKNNCSIYDAEYRIKRANDGAIVWMKSTGQYQYDEFGVAVTLTGINLDITQQREAEEKMRQSEKLFKSIFDNSLAAIVVADDQGNYLSANKAASELLGYSVKELLQMNVGDLKTTEKQGTAERFEQYARKGEETGEFDFTTKNDLRKFVQYQAIRIKADFHLSIMMEITDKKQSSLYARSLIEASLDPLVTISPEGKITDVNEASVKVTGETRDKLIGTDFSDYFTEPEKAREGYKQVFEKGFVSDYPLTIHHKNGKLTDVLYNASVYNDDIGNVLGVFAAARDVTEQNRITKALNVAKEIAENAAIAKQQFLSNMSHEIRTPMNAIIGFTKVLGKTDLTEKQKEYVRAVKSSGDTLIVLINDILDLAKVDAGKMVFVKAPFKITDSINTIVNLFEIKIKENNLELVKKYDNSIPEIVLGDAIRLHQILINLLSNAVKFTLKGKVMVSVTLLGEDIETVTIEIKISDTGIGIAQNKIATIFENFEQAQNNISSLYGGTGLGLAIVKQLVEKQGGTISVISKVDEGSTFSFTLSFEKTTASIVLENEIGHYQTEIKPLRVLVVEDVKLNQLLMKIILEDFKFDYDIAENGQIAIEKLQNNSYDIILMDLQMPVMNGFEATKYIRHKMNLQIPIIALTADVTTVDLEKCKAAGMNDYASKPLDEKILHSKILELVKR